MSFLDIVFPPRGNDVSTRGNNVDPRIDLQS
jgi:hypothetical protein